jgi:hypothetical protein
MHARVTCFKVIPEKIDEASRLIEEIRSHVLEFPGVVEVLGLEKAGGTERLVIAIYDSRAHADAAIPGTLRAWHALGCTLAAAPQSSSYEVVARDVAT